MKNDQAGKMQLVFLRSDSDSWNADLQFSTNEYLLIFVRCGAFIDMMI